jgi:preprotein translocase subunit SecG
MLNLLMVLLLIVSVLLIVLILIQRGKGGGLAGAFGGMGGQSAFGTKAGDLFTRITIVLAIIWILLCMAMVKLSGSGGSVLNTDIGGGADAKPGVSAPVSTEKQPAGQKAETPAAPAKNATTSEKTPAKGNAK